MSRTGAIRPGSLKIRPPKGSPLAQAWEEPSQIEANEIPLDAVLQLLTQRLAISVDLSELPPESRTMLVTKNLKGLPLRHVLALILDDLNLRAEARGGDTIAILPQSRSRRPGGTSAVGSGGEAAAGKSKKNRLGLYEGRRGCH